MPLGVIILSSNRHCILKFSKLLSVTKEKFNRKYKLQISSFATLEFCKQHDSKPL